MTSFENVLGSDEGLSGREIYTGEFVGIHSHRGGRRLDLDLFLRASSSFSRFERVLVGLPFYDDQLAVVPEHLPGASEALRYHQRISRNKLLHLTIRVRQNQLAAQHHHVLIDGERLGDCVRGRIIFEDFHDQLFAPIERVSARSVTSFEKVLGSDKGLSRGEIYTGEFVGIHSHRRGCSLCLDLFHRVSSSFFGSCLGLHTRPCEYQHERW